MVDKFKFIFTSGVFEMGGCVMFLGNVCVVGAVRYSVF